MGISLKQKQILAFPYTKKYQALICDGAVRSGKTSFMTVAFVDWAMREFKNTNFAICGKTVGSAIKNIIVPYMTLAYTKERYHVHFTRSDNKMIVRRGSTSNVFYIYGGKDESSYMLIQGITLAGVLFDEVALMTRSFVEQALARCVSYKNRRYWFNCNPDSPNHWFYQEWILQPEKHRALHLHLLMEDNPILDQETIEEAGNTWSGVFYDRYVLGKWVIAEGRVYPRFGEQNILRGSMVGMDGRFFVSVDYGTVNPCSMGLWCIRGKQAIRIKEYYYDSRKVGKQKTDEEYYADLDNLAKGYPIQWVIVDPSAASFKETIRRHRHFAVRDAVNDVIDGIRVTDTLLNNGMIIIHESCKDSIREFSLYRWDEKRNEDAVLKENDHAMDEIRYLAVTVLAREYRWADWKKGAS